MNFYFRLKNKTGFLFILRVLIFMLVSGTSYSQYFELGSPLVENFGSATYGYENQNYSIVQDEKGLMYFGNLSGILEFDGSVWRLIKMQGVPALALSGNKRIFVGGYNEFGFLSAKPDGEIRYVSLLETLELSARNFGSVVQVLPHGKDGVVFFTKDSFFYCDGKKIVKISSDIVYNRAFVTGDEILLATYSKGIFRFTASTLQHLPELDYFKNKYVRGILPYNSTLLIKTDESKSFYRADKGKITPFYTDADQFIEMNQFSIAKELSDGNYAIGTHRCGIIVIDKKGKVITRINRKTGLSNEDITDLYVDRDGSLWITTHKGISRAEIPDAFSYFEPDDELVGGGLCVYRHNNILYIGTTLGLYTLHGENPEESANSCTDNYTFRPVQNVISECNSFFLNNDILLLSSNDGLYVIDGQVGIRIFEGHHEAVVRASFDTSLFIVSWAEGIFTMKREGKEWIKTGKLNQLNAHIRTIAQDEIGNLWLGSNYTGLYQVSFSGAFDEDAMVKNISSGNGLPDEYAWIDVYSTSSGVLFSTSKGVYRLNAKINRFVLDTLLGFDFQNEERWLYPIFEDYNKNLWISSGTKDKYGKTSGVLEFRGHQKKFKPNFSPFDKLSEFTIENFFIDQKNIVWMNTFDGIIRCDTSMFQKTLPTFQALIRRITVGNDSLLNLTDSADAQNEEASIELDYEYNSLRFVCANTNYIYRDKIRYQYYLEGFDKDWGEWVIANEKEYTNLPEGEYVFRVRAKNISNILSEEVSYNFSIKPPVYRTWWAYCIYAIFLTSFIIMIMKWRSYLFEKEKNYLEKVISERTEELVIEKERAEQLIASILPKQTAEELKSVGTSMRKKYKMVTVLFSDIQGFSKIAEHMKPEKLLDDLDKYFFRFDNVVEKYNIEKIKSIGDTYMCAGGIPMKNKTNPIDVVMAAQEMKQHMKELKKTSENDWNIRIGIHSGPVIAGVVGTKKIAYDIWGDTVNIASRMEAAGTSGEISISETTYELVSSYFDCELKSSIPVKYKGDIGIFKVNGLKKEYSDDGITPNEEFRIKLQEIRFDDLEELIMTKMEKGLSKNLYYHNLKHTIDVITQVELIGRNEKVSNEEMLLLKTAALFHDAGFLLGFDEHELLGIKLANEILPGYFYSEAQLKTIHELIYSTKLPPNPGNLLEEIMCDADLDYLGRSDFLPVSQNLFRELYEHEKIKTIEDWNRLQVKFISGHRFYTQTARELREENKKRELEKLKTML